MPSILSYEFARHLRNGRQIPDPTRYALHVQPSKHAPLPSTPCRRSRTISLAPVISTTTITCMPAPTEPSSCSIAPHFWQINPKLARKFMQHASAHKRHNYCKEDLVWVTARIVYKVAPQLAQLAVEVLQVSIAWLTTIAARRGAVRRVGATSGATGVA